MKPLYIWVREASQTPAFIAGIIFLLIRKNDYINSIIISFIFEVEVHHSMCQTAFISQFASRILNHPIFCMAVILNNKISTKKNTFCDETKIIHLLTYKSICKILVENYFYCNIQLISIISFLIKVKTLIWNLSKPYSIL